MYLTDEMTNSLENFNNTLLGSMMQVKEPWAAISLKTLWERQLNRMIEEHTYLGNIYDIVSYCDLDEDNINSTSIPTIDLYVEESYNSLVEALKDHARMAELIYGAISASFYKFEDMWVLCVKFGTMEDEQIIRYLEIL